MVSENAGSNVFLQVIEKVFRLIDESGDGLVTQPQIMDFLTNLTNSRYVATLYQALKST